MANIYSNLAEKTFLDFTTDKDIIDEITLGIDPETFKTNLPEWGRYTTFVEFAELTNNKELKDEINKQLGYMMNE